MDLVAETDRASDKNHAEEVRMMRRRPKRPTDEQVMLADGQGLAGSVGIREPDVPGASGKR